MLRKIPVADLRLGMHLHELCGAWLDHPFWKTRFVLRDPADLQKLLASSVREAWIDTSKGCAVDTRRSRSRRVAIRNRCVSRRGRRRQRPLLRPPRPRRANRCRPNCSVPPRS
jgi:Domain of unknown function (DUF3391)